MPRYSSALVALVDALLLQLRSADLRLAQKASWSLAHTLLMRKLSEVRLRQLSTRQCRNSVRQRIGRVLLRA